MPPVRQRLRDQEIDRLVNNPEFIQLEFPEKVQTLRDAGLSEFDASQRAVEAERRKVEATGTRGSVAFPQPNFANRVLGTAGQAGKQAILPTTGAVLGGATSPFFGVPPQIGASAGSVAGEVANQVFGMSPPSLEQIGLAAVTPGPARGIGRGMASAVPALQPQVLSPATSTRIAQRIPGAGGAINELAQQEIMARPNVIRAQTRAMFGRADPGELFDIALRQTNPQVRLTNTGSAARELARRQAKAASGGTGSPTIRRIANTLAARADEGTQDLEFLDIQRRQLGGLLGSVRNKETQTQIRRLLAGVFQDIDVAAQAGIPGARQLQQAVSLSRRNLAADDLDAFLNRPGVLKRQRADGFQELDIGRILDGVRRSRSGRNPPSELRLFAGSLENVELDELEDLLTFWLDRTQVAPPPSGVQAGSQSAVNAASAAFALTGDPQVAAGTAAGRFLLSRVLMSNMGRRILRQRLADGVEINLGEIAGLMVINTARQSLGPAPVQRVLQGPQITSNR